MSNRDAFLTMIATSELGAELLAKTANGYNVIVGSTAAAPITLTDYSRHPRVLVFLPSLGSWSSAAGRYQILTRYADAYTPMLHLPDFGPQSQDAIALQMIRECDALDDIDAGRFADAVSKCASRWASLPGSTAGQHTNEIAALSAAYTQAGGLLA